MSAPDLLAAARDLIDTAGDEPRQANLLRAMSTIYYALYHTLAKVCADMLIGDDTTSRSQRAWNQVYRAIDHSFANICDNDARIGEFPKEVQDFANMFVTMQRKRHTADYHPRPPQLGRSEVLLDLGGVEKAIEDFLACETKHKRAFAALAVVKTRKI